MVRQRHLEDEEDISSDFMFSNLVKCSVLWLLETYYVLWVLMCSHHFPHNMQISLRY